MDALTDAELTILGLLVEHPRHGYELEHVIEERGVRNWTALGFSSIYYVLDKLAKRGLIEAMGPRASAKSRVPFAATEAGRAQCAAATREALAEPSPVRARVLVAMANSAALPDADVAAGLAERRAALRERLAELRAIRAAQEPLPVAARGIFDYSEAMLEAEIAWADTTLTTYDQETAMEKYDVKQARKDLYAPSAKDFAVVEVPELRYLAVDGHGDPNADTAYSDAVEALYSTAYTLKFASKADGRDFTVGPLEGLWRADDLSAFVERRKEDWAWTMLISLPEWITDDQVKAAVAKAAEKKDNPALAKLRVLTLNEGASVQILHRGPYDDEAPTLDRLHNAYMPANGLAFNGDHHEIYLNDPRRTEPAKLKTVLRQPVRPV
ncbi:GyrI-like domain-containing protein [Glycomyces sp. MUSA5-2]|uniref:GyrI-like domain-containing protein n=1 Tax=Glycomyces sp. MUSA5-2 TaxID=2053002 RepID=UPI003008F3AB